MDIIPPILHEYIQKLKLESSNLQILDFVDEDTLQEAKKYLNDEISAWFCIPGCSMHERAQEAGPACMHACMLV